MLTPIVACTALLLSFFLPHLGLVLVAETRKDNDQTLYLTTTTKQDRFRWAAIGWFISIAGVCLIPIPYIIMVLADREGWYIVMFVLFICQCGIWSDYDSPLDRPVKPKRDPALTEPKML